MCKEMRGQTLLPLNFRSFVKLREDKMIRKNLKGISDLSKKVF